MIIIILMDIISFEILRRKKYINDYLLLLYLIGHCYSNMTYELYVINLYKKLYNLWKQLFRLKYYTPPDRY